MAILTLSKMKLKRVARYSRFVIPSIHQRTAWRLYNFFCGNDKEAEADWETPVLKRYMQRGTYMTCPAFHQHEEASITIPRKFWRHIPIVPFTKDDDHTSSLKKYNCPCSMFFCGTGHG